MSYPTPIIELPKRKIILMETFVAVFTTPDETPVFWGAFANYPDADSAIDDYLKDHKSWARADFTAQSFPFGVLL
jgi:hypothetical protein